MSYIPPFWWLCKKGYCTYIGNTDVTGDGGDSGGDSGGGETGSINYIPPFWWLCKKGYDIYMGNTDVTGYGGDNGGGGATGSWESPDVMTPNRWQPPSTLTSTYPLPYVPQDDERPITYLRTPDNHIFIRLLTYRKRQFLQYHTDRLPIDCDRPIYSRIDSGNIHQSFLDVEPWGADGVKKPLYWQTTPYTWIDSFGIERTNQCINPDGSPVRWTGGEYGGEYQPAEEFVSPVPDYFGWIYPNQSYSLVGYDNYTDIITDWSLYQHESSVTDVSVYYPPWKMVTYRQVVQWRQYIIYEYRFSPLPLKKQLPAILGGNAVLSFFSLITLYGASARLIFNHDNTGTAIDDAPKRRD